MPFQKPEGKLPHQVYKPRFFYDELSHVINWCDNNQFCYAESGCIWVAKLEPRCFLQRGVAIAWMDTIARATAYPATLTLREWVQ